MPAEEEGRMRKVWVAGWALALAGAAAAADDLEDRLSYRWNGAWVVLTTGVRSDCGPNYTNNRVEGGRLAGNGTVAFGAGELAQVHKVDVRRSRVDLLLDLEERFLLPHRDGPFTLYDDSHCRVELLFDVPRSMVRNDDAEGIEARFAQVLERHDRLEEARESARWNRRRREPFPADYEETLARYQVWKAEQVNGAVQARLDRAIEDAAAVGRSIRSDPAYLDGFAVGAEDARDAYIDSGCEWLVDASFYSFKRSPPGGRDRPRAWRDGYEDGQLLIFSLELARRLPACFVPVPPPPGGW